MRKHLANTKPIRIANFLTWDTSLESREEGGHLSREIPYFVWMARHAAHITTITWGGMADTKIAGKFPEGSEFIPFHAHVPRPGNRFVRLLLSPLILWPARHTLRECDCIRIEQMVGGWCAVLAKYLFRKPLIVRTGYEFHKFTIARGKGLGRRVFSYLISRLTYSCADLILVTSEADREFVIKNFGILPDRITVHPNWTDVKKFSPPGKARATNEILFVGRIDPQKNLPLLIEAAEGTGWRVTIIGDGPERASVEDMARKRCVEAEFLGNIPNNELVEHYRRCTVYVLPSMFEGHPKTLLEAMSCGCAVVGTNVDGIRPVIRDGVDGLLVEESVLSLRNGLEKLMSSPELRKRMGMAAAKYVRDELSIDTLLDREMECFRTIQK